MITGMALLIRPRPPARPDGAAPSARLQDAVVVVGRKGRAIRSLDGVSLAVAAGRFTALVGQAGSGKSTLLRCLAGNEGLTSGRALVGNVDLGGLRARPLRRLRGARVAQISGASTTEADWFVAILGTSARPGDGPPWAAAVRDLACAPKLILADDVAGAELLAFLRRMVDAFGQTVVMATRDPAAAARADHSFHLADGRVVERRAGLAA